MAAALARVAGWLALASVAVLALKYCPMPWAMVLLGLAMALGAIARRCKNHFAQSAVVCLAAGFGAVGGFEFYLGVEQIRGDGTRLEGSIAHEFAFEHTDDLLGYAPARDSRVTSRKYYGNELLYDVVYTINSDGLRIALPVDGAELRDCVVFFGDSITFGEGVNDDDTLPYQVGLKTGGRYPIYNFAFSGYGPHQMLSSLLSGRVDQTVRCRPMAFIYLAIPEHVARVAGLTFWDPHGPRYELTENGEVVRRGNFDDGPAGPNAWLSRPLKTALDRSFTWQRLAGRARDPSPTDLNLLTAVVVEAARLTNAVYSGSEFHVILWDGRSEDTVQSIETKLTTKGVSVHRMTSIVPDVNTDWPSYVLSAHDRHPNPLLHKLVADYVARRIVATLGEARAAK